MAVASLAMAFVSAGAEALSLGDARVTSGLNAPLVAEIEVLDATPDELRLLRAEVPAREVFTRYGLDWPAFLATASVTARLSRQRLAIEPPQASVRRLVRDCRNCSSR